MLHQLRPARAENALSQCITSATRSQADWASAVARLVVTLTENALADACSPRLRETGTRNRTSPLKPVSKGLDAVEKLFGGGPAAPEGDGKCLRRWPAIAYRASNRAIFSGKVARTP